jgi:N-acylglucosamine 2-epimerase
MKTLDIQHFSEHRLADFYKNTLLEDIIPFWLKNGMDHEHGGIITALDRDGTVVDTDKSVWFQGRAAWTFGILCKTYGVRSEWLDAAASCIGFLRRTCADPETGKLYFTVTREGKPLRMRRYVYSESFAAIACAVYASVTGEERARQEAIQYFSSYLEYSFTPGKIPPKVDPRTRPAKGIGPMMIGIATAQELREHIGDVEVRGKTCSEWIAEWIQEVRGSFMHHEKQVLLEMVSPDGKIIDHFDGRMLNPGHAIEAAWFILHEARYRKDVGMQEAGLTILDWMWKKGWDEQYGGILYFRDVCGLPVQEYWQDMKFWWPHNEAVIATLLAWKMTGEKRWLEKHHQVHNWSFQHFADPEYGEWYGYLRRDGTPSTKLKGTMWKGPFHLPRMLWYCHRILTTE